jgi:acetyl esterase
VGRDPEYLRFIRRVAEVRAAAAPSSIEAARKDFRRSMTYAPRPPMARVQDLEVPGGDGPVRARLLVPADAGDDALVYVHGGGWHLGGLDDWEPVARVIAQTTGCPVLEIEHRQAPEHPFPAPLDDVRAALRWAVETPATLGARRVGVVGDSSGGNLAAAAARHVDGLAIQVLVYPAVDLTRDPEPIEDPDGIAFPRAMAQTRERYVGAADPSDPDLSPACRPPSCAWPSTTRSVARDWPTRSGSTTPACRWRSWTPTVSTTRSWPGARSRAGRQRRSRSSVRRCDRCSRVNENDTVPSRPGCSPPRRLPRESS